MLRRQTHADHVLSGYFDSPVKPARQGGALHKTVARHPENAYFWLGPKTGVDRFSGKRMGHMAAICEPITIKRYANRLYHPTMGVYVTLRDLAAMIEDDEDIVVTEAATGEDITRSVLKQIIIERGSHG